LRKVSTESGLGRKGWSKKFSKKLFIDERRWCMVCYMLGLKIFGNVCLTSMLESRGIVVRKIK
jgi:hypothetical protein